MLQALMLRYGFKDFDFLRKASSPKLESLGVSSLLPVEGELVKNGDDEDDKPSSSPPEASGNKVETGLARGSSRVHPLDRITQR